MKHELFMKAINGDKVYCLEYDKETLKDIVIEKQEEIEKLREEKESWRRLATKYFNINEDAREYINSHIICYCPGENEHYEFDYITANPKDLLNILEGK